MAVSGAERRADELERLLAQAVAQEHAARVVGAADQQAIAMQEIRELRFLLQQARGR